MDMKHKSIFLLLPSLLFISGCEYDGRYESYDNAASYTLLEEQKADISASDLTFKYLNISWHRGNVKVIATDTGTVSIIETSNVEPKGTLVSRYAILDETLYVKYADSGSNLSDKLTKDLTVYVNITLPELSNLDYKFTNTVGDVEMENIDAKDLYISIFHGNITLTNIEVDLDPQVATNRGSVLAVNLFFTGTLEVVANYEIATINPDERITGFNAIFQMVDALSYVDYERFPKNGDFYGSHMIQDVTIRVVSTGGTLYIV